MEDTRTYNLVRNILHSPTQNTEAAHIFISLDSSTEYVVLVAAKIHLPPQPSPKKKNQTVTKTSLDQTSLETLTQSKQEEEARAFCVCLLDNILFTACLPFLDKSLLHTALGVLVLFFGRLQF